MRLHNPAQLLQFLHTIANLKSTKRTGWVRHGILDCESISDHMHRMAILVMLIQDTHLDRDRCIRMAIVHDIAEAITGDITPNCGVTKEEKHRLEKEAIQKLCTMLAPMSLAEKDINELWHEYEQGATAEARLVKELDKFEMIVQAFEYEKKHVGMAPLHDFFHTTRGAFTHPQIQTWAAQLYADRHALLGYEV